MAEAQNFEQPKLYELTAPVLEADMLVAERQGFEVAAQRLVGELTLAHAPLSGKRMACVLETEEATHAGHNLETAPNSLRSAAMMHAETMALHHRAAADDSSPIKRVYMSAQNQTKLKHVAPCGRCYNQLNPHLADDAELLLISPNSHDSVAVIGGGILKAAYDPLEPLELKTISILDTIDELRRVTPLDEDDLYFTAALRYMGLGEQISFYLTGSASGRNSIGSVLTAGYDDYKLVAVPSKGNEMSLPYAELKINRLFTEFFEAAYGACERREYEVMNWESWHPIRGIAYKSGSKTVQLHVADRLNLGMARKDYWEKNFYLKLS